MPSSEMKLTDTTSTTTNGAALLLPQPQPQSRRRRSSITIGDLDNAVLEATPPNRQMMLMDNARASASFDPQQLTHILYGGKEAVRLKQEALARVERSLGETDSSRLPRAYGEIDRTAAYHEGLAMGSALLLDKINHNNHSLFDRATHHHALANASPFGLHCGMFIPTLKLQASPEQLAYWLPLAESGKIIGTYCQTEMGHGSFVRGLETTATFDHDTDEFIINSPTVSSTKYWPGGLAFSSSHAIVMARLIIGRKDHGVHPFMTQLRSLEDYTPLPGIELGDIGPKLGLNSNDNGYAIFTDVRIPRHHLLMGNVKVLRDGTYLGGKHSKLAYGTMVYTRNLIVYVVGFQLAQAATIAIRYSVVREQGHLSQPSASTATPPPPPNSEVSILAYKSQHYRLLSILSRAFAIVFSADACESLYQRLLSLQRRGDHSTLSYAHITTAALKAYSTQTAVDGAEDARKCCGGHGYSLLSGLPEIVGVLLPTATLEGENYVMYQQCARFLVGVAARIRRGGEGGDQDVGEEMRYLKEGYEEMRRAEKEGVPIRCTAQGEDFLKPQVQLAVFRHRAVRLIFECEEALSNARERGVPWSEAWNTNMMELIMAARAHIETFVLQSFISKIASPQVQSTTTPTTSASIPRILQHLCNTFFLTSIESPSSIGALAFFSDSYISLTQLRLSIRPLLNATLGKLLPEAVGLTDAWAFSDASLQSALGRRDGNVYETLLEWTRQVPINRRVGGRGGGGGGGGVEREGYERYIKPILRAKL